MSNRSGVLRVLFYQIDQYLELVTDLVVDVHRRFFRRFSRGRSRAGQIHRVEREIALYPFLPGPNNLHRPGPGGAAVPQRHLPTSLRSCLKAMPTLGQAEDGDEGSR